MDLQDDALRIIRLGTDEQQLIDNGDQACSRRDYIAETGYESLRLRLHVRETYQHIRSLYRSEHQLRLRCETTKTAPAHFPTLRKPDITGEMAGSRKYADLPDLDAAPEIYETPELTDDASTVQTNTLRTESPSPSEDARTSHNVDRARLNREEARRRFEPAVVDARDTNLSDAIGGYRKGYRTTHQRKRRPRRKNGADEYSDHSSGSEEEEESLGKRLARLKREAEELRLELARSEGQDEDDEFKDTYEHHQNGDERDDKNEMVEGVEELSRLLDDLRSSSRRSKGETLEDEFSRQLAGHDAKSKQQHMKVSERRDTAATTTNPVSAIAAFADRLTALETTLGISSIPSNTDSVYILPTLNTLSSQINVLSQTIQPPSSSPEYQPNLDAISDRLRDLQSETDTLLSTRKAALQTLASLHEVRHRNSNNSSSYAKFASRREARERQRDSYPSTVNADENADHTIPTGDNSAGQQPKPLSATTPTTPHQTESNLFTEIFLEEQSSKITALYNTLPTIQSLQPLLPVVLDRLRGLSIVHAGAASAHNEMEELESRLSAWEADLVKWREAVTSVEKGIEQSREIMQENVNVVGGMVRSVEERLSSVEGKK